VNKRINILAIFLALSLVFLNGCIKRNLHIRSNPSGAKVYFNEEYVGVTPLDYDFIYYAVHRVRLEREDYRPFEVLENIQPPVFSWFPIDFFFELLPYTFWDKKEVTYTLIPLSEKIDN